MKKKTLLGIIGLALVIDRFAKRKQSKKLEMTIELGHTLAPSQDPIRYELPKSAACPYCGYKYSKIPKRSQKCIECKKYIYRTKNLDRRAYEFITEEQHCKQVEQAAQSNRARSEEYARSTLHRYRDSGIERVEISIAGKDSCSSCKNQSRKMYLIEDALREMPIPCRSCTFNLRGERASIGWCRCAYIADLPGANGARS